MAVGPVRSELVSDQKSLFTGNLQGNLRVLGAFVRISSRFVEVFQRVMHNFPALSNR